LFPSQSESATDQLAAHCGLAWWVCCHPLSKATITGFATLNTARFNVAFRAWHCAVAERHTLSATAFCHGGWIHVDLGFCY
jgi:hypothetical protein